MDLLSSPHWEWICAFLTAEHKLRQLQRLSRRHARLLSASSFSHDALLLSAPWLAALTASPHLQRLLSRVPEVLLLKCVTPAVPQFPWALPPPTAELPLAALFPHISVLHEAELQPESCPSLALNCSGLRSLHSLTLDHVSSADFIAVLGLPLLRHLTCQRGRGTHVAEASIGGQPAGIAVLAAVKEQRLAARLLTLRAVVDWTEVTTAALCSALVASAEHGASTLQQLRLTSGNSECGAALDTLAALSSLQSLSLLWWYGPGLPSVPSSLAALPHLTALELQRAPGWEPTEPVALPVGAMPAPPNPRDQERLTDLLTGYLPALAARLRVLHLTLPSQSALSASAVRGLLSLVQLEELTLAAEPLALWPNAEAFAPLPHCASGFPRLLKLSLNRLAVLDRGLQALLQLAPVLLSLQLDKCRLLTGQAWWLVAAAQCSSTLVELRLISCCGVNVEGPEPAAAGPSPARPFASLRVLEVLMVDHAALQTETLLRLLPLLCFAPLWYLGLWSSTPLHPGFVRRLVQFSELRALTLNWGMPSLQLWGWPQPPAPPLLQAAEQAFHSCTGRTSRTQRLYSLRAARQDRALGQPSSAADAASELCYRAGADERRFPLPFRTARMTGGRTARAAFFAELDQVLVSKNEDSWPLPAPPAATDTGALESGLFVQYFDQCVAFPLHQR